MKASSVKACTPWLLLLLFCGLAVHACTARAPVIMKDLAEPPDTHDVLEAGAEDLRADDYIEPELVLEDLVDMSADVQSDVCVPDCADKTCGPDGCGGTCGQCSGPDSCIDGQCSCLPVCTATCGPDGCGGLCAECPAGQSCQSGTCEGCPETLVFDDAALEELVATATGTVPGATKPDDIADLITLEGIETDISTLDGLECLTALMTLNLSGNNLQDIAPIAALLHLDYLALTDNDIEDMSPLNQLPFLTTLVISANAITDLSSLKAAWHLETLKVSQNNITNLSPLSNLTTLRTLDVSGNNITDLSPLSKIPTLEILEAHSNAVFTISPLPPTITKLILHHNAITDLSPLLTDPAITPNDTIDIRSNPIDCQEQSAAIEQLISIGVDVVHDCLVD